jgi:hypothetical protein
MKKLLKLKEWLTLPDAAKHLSIIFDEDVSEADVLRLALDGQLQLSVYFVNQAAARRGKMVPLSEAKKTPGIPLGLDGKPFESDEVIRGLRIFYKDPDGHEEEKVVQFDEEIVFIDGIWDLPMQGNGRLDVEHKYQMLATGVKVTDVNLDGTYLWGLDGELWELQSNFNENKFQKGSLAHLEKLQAKIVDENIEESEAKRLLDQHKEARKSFLEKKKSGHAQENYYPAGGLPEDSVLVVRTEALRNLEQKGIEAPEQGTEKTLSTTERNTLLKVIGVMAKKGYGHDLSKPYEAAGEIEKDAEELGIKISNDTIANKLKEAKKIMEDKQE